MLPLFVQCVPVLENSLQVLLYASLHGHYILLVLIAGLFAWKRHRQMDRKQIQAEIEKAIAADPDSRIIPDRGNMSDPTINWRKGSQPSFDGTDLQYLTGKTQRHKAGSLEKIVENLVKTWEMEASHKSDITQWTTIDLPNYTCQSNAGKIFPGKDAAKIGNYNWILSGCPKDVYDYETEDFESADKHFRGAFPEGFPWELVNLYSGPPKVAFSWRHWATFSGEHKGVKGQGQQVIMEGFCIATVNSDLKLQHLEVYLKAEEFLKQLQ